LGGASGYTLGGLRLAAAGLLSPPIAGAAMALSSVSVLANALLLSRWRPPASVAEAPDMRRAESERQTAPMAAAPRARRIESEQQL